MLKFEKSWKDFQKHLGNEKIQPTSRDYLQYFHHLQYTEGNKMDIDYGNTGCRVFKRGIQNQKYFCLKNQQPKGNN